MKNIILIFLILALFYNLFYIFRKKKKMNKFNKNKKTILITGSSDGIGKEFVLSLDPKIYQVIITGRCKKKINNLKNEIRSRNIENIGIPCDLSDISQIYNLYKESIRHFGKIDILVNNFFSIDKLVSLDRSSNEEIINHINTNISNVFAHLNDLILS